MSDVFTSWQKIVRGAPNGLGWRNLEIAEGEEHRGEHVDETFTPILSLIHLSDLHVCDAQSPARGELVDRFADPHNPISEMVGLVGS